MAKYYVQTVPMEPEPDASMTVTNAPYITVALPGTQPVAAAPNIGSGISSVPWPVGGWKDIDHDLPDSVDLVNQIRRGGRQAWECPRCHRMNAPHVDQCTCTPDSE